MTITHYGNQQYYGLSTDTKPVPADTAVYALFDELDTSDQYINNGTAWVLHRTAPAPAAPVLGGGAEAYRRLGTTQNRWYIGNQFSNGTLGAFAMVANTLYAAPFIVAKTCSVNDMGINVTIGVTSAVVRVGIYSDLNGYPDTRLKDAGTMAATAVTFESNAVSPALELEPGLYWLAAVSGHAPTVKAVPTADSYPILGFDNVAASQIAGTGWSVSFTMGTLPSTFTAGGTVRIAAMPAVYVRLV